MIEVNDLAFSYGSREDIFKNINLRFSKGQAWTVIGPSGCGKSTLLYLLAGLLKPTHGVISISGQRIIRPRPETGLVLQDHGLLPWATVLENAKMGHKIRKFYGADGVHSPKDLILSDLQIEDKVSYWLERLGLSDFRDMYPSQLSRGQRQRAAIARTLVLEPDLLLMDEPFSALDAPIREDLQGVMSGFHQESRMTSITVTHDIEEAVFLGEKILILSSKKNITPKIISGEFFGDIDRHDNPAFLQRCRSVKSLLAKMDGGGAR
ncbi:MAG: ABC transporter ATP-binding protein [Desulfotalea sp.]